MREIFTLRMFRRVSLILCLALTLVLPGHARGAGPAPVSGMVKIAEGGLLPWTIMADKLMYDEEKHLYEAEGNVRISSRDRMIEADYASVNNQTRQADLNGKVTVQYGRNWVKGQHIIWNLDTENGWLDSGVLYFAENNFFIQGKSISKLSPVEYELKEGFITSCNPADPDWKIQFNNMKVTVGGSALTKDISFWARSWPVAYWPLLKVPVDTQRQSGFLLPFAGGSSLNGYQAEIPYYWAFREDMDATFYAEYLQKRGFMGGAEYRINSQEWGKGVWMFNYLDDHADKTALSNYGFPFQTHDRYWVRGKQDIELPWNIEAKIDVDYVSDGNFLQEFSTGSSSFGHSNNIFGSYFARNLLYDQTSLVRESDVYLEKRGDSALFSLDARYWETLETPLKDRTTQELPSFSFDIIPKAIGGTPVYYSLQSSAVNYWRTEGDTDQRLNVYPRAYYPLHWGNYLDIEPSVGLRANAYTIQWETSGFDSFAGRAAPDVAVDMSTRLNREFPVNFWNFAALQHAIRPEVSYEYAVQSVSGTIPQLDRLDLDQSRNGVRYGFTSFLTGKEVITDAAGNTATSYRELLRFKVFQFFNVQTPSIEDPLFDTSNVMRQGFSPIGIRMDIMPKKYITVSYDLDLDLSSSGQGRAQNLFVAFDSTAGHIVRIDYEQIPSLMVNEITATTYIQTYKNFYLDTYHSYSLSSGIMFDQGYGFRYIKGCWGFGAGYERVGADNRFIFTIDLMGIGSLSGQSGFFGKPLFGEPIPGYQHPETYMLSK